MRGISYRKQVEEKKIRKRMRIAKLWRLDDNEPHPIELQPHSAHKWNLNCGCKMCHFYKWIGNHKEKFSYRDLRDKQKYEENIKQSRNSGLL